MVNFVAAVAYHFCLALPAAFTQPGTRLLEPSPVHTFPSRSAGAVSGEGVAVGAVQAGAVVAAVVAPPPGRTSCNGGGVKA